MKKQYKPISKCRTVYDLLENPDRWTKHILARDKAGIPTNILDKNAVSWCLSGAMDKVYGPKIGIDIWLKAEKIINGVANFNDNPKTTHEKLLKMVKKLKI